MLKHFPKTPESMELVNAADEGGVRRAVIERLIEEYIQADHLLVEINRHLGGHFPKAKGIDFIVQHGEHGAKITNRAFTGVVCILSNGVAGGFKVGYVQTSVQSSP